MTTYDCLWVFTSLILFSLFIAIIDLFMIAINNNRKKKK